MAIKKKDESVEGIQIMGVRLYNRKSKMDVFARLTGETQTLKVGFSWQRLLVSNVPPIRWVRSVLRGIQQSRVQDKDPLTAIRNAKRNKR